MTEDGYKGQTISPIDKSVPQEIFIWRKEDELKYTQ